MDQAIVNIEQGTLNGSILTCVFLGLLTKNSNECKYYSFSGIPFAKSPTGDLRFKAPEPPEKWENVLDATKEGNACIGGNVITQLNNESEDCLNLNVYTRELPNKNTTHLKPVMVWIYGGGFTSGSNTGELYGPEFLLGKNVVVVTINYRIGLLGFLSLKDDSLGIPGNAGLKDQIMALKWVQKNIASFGGNPNQVTIFGESAGGTCVDFLMLSPLSKGLFHRAISESSNSLSDWSIQRSNATLEIANILGQNDIENEKALYDALMGQTSDELLKLQNTAMLKQIYPPPIFAPTVENESSDAFLTDLPINLLRAGKFNKVPVIFGYNSDEGMLIRVRYTDDQLLNLDWTTFLPYHLGYSLGSNESNVLGKIVKDFYLDEEEPNVDDLRNIYAPATDTYFAYGISLSAKFHSNFSDQNVYLYRFERNTSLNFMRVWSNFTGPGVCHADELGYIFKTFLTPPLKAESVEATYINQMTTLWTNFAKSGDPTYQDHEGVLGGLKWGPVTPKNFNVLKITDDKLVSDEAWPEQKRYMFWKKVHEESPNGENYVYDK